MGGCAVSHVCTALSCVPPVIPSMLHIPADARARLHSQVIAPPSEFPFLLR